MFFRAGILENWEFLFGMFGWEVSTNSLPGPLDDSMTLSVKGDGSLAISSSDVSDFSGFLFKMLGWKVEEDRWWQDRESEVEVDVDDVDDIDIDVTVDESIVS
jgi:hypothetical protein